MTYRCAAKGFDRAGADGQGHDELIVRRREAPDTTGNEKARHFSRAFSSLLSGVACLSQARSLGEVQHALQWTHGIGDQRRVDDYLVTALTQALQGTLKRIHRHPRAMCTTPARRAVAGRRRLDEDLVRAQLLHLVEDASVSGHDERLVGQALRCGNHLAGGADHVSQLDDCFRRLRVNQNRRLGVQGFHVFELLGFELFVDDAGTVPQQHIGTGFTLNVTTQVLIWRPDDFLTVVHQALDDLQRAARGHHPVRTGFDGCRGVGIHHHGTLRVLVAKSGELVDRAPHIERAGGFERRHEHAFFRVENFRGFAHETYTRHQHSAGCMVIAEARHFQRVGHATTGFLGQRLDNRITIIVSDQHGVLLLEFLCNVGTVMRLLCRAQRPGLFGIEMRLHQETFGDLCHVHGT
ncbi:Uncharacterized protein ALO45_05526 [Pseudomonas syringae pv. syringae]|nr:Uncharacterized protein ALO45_05526 [Pseudomonas syringae pv. syringae]